jgi:hypothetical protein
MCCFTQSIHTLSLSVGGRTHARTDGRTDGRTENFYSIFRDKLLPTKIPQKSVVLHKIYTPYAYVGGRTDGRTHGRTENIYSIFRDKLLLLGEHGHSDTSC